MSHLHAVATGDIVASSKMPLPERRRLPTRLREAYNTVQKQASEAFPYPLAIMRGDGWQCLVNEPSQALMRVLQFCALLFAQGVRTRFALAIDEVDFITERGLNESDGPAFRRSGRAVKRLENDRWIICKLPKEAPSIYQLLANDQ